MHLSLRLLRLATLVEIRSVIVMEALEVNSQTNLSSYYFERVSKVRTRVHFIMPYSQSAFAFWSMSQIFILENTLLSPY